MTHIILQDVPVVAVICFLVGLVLLFSCERGPNGNWERMLGRCLFGIFSVLLVAFAAVYFGQSDKRPIKNVSIVPATAVQSKQGME